MHESYKDGNRYERGFSLLELLLVIAIMAVILLASLQKYRQYILDKDLEVVRHNVALLMQGLDEYYADLLMTQCKKQPTDSCPIYQQKAIIQGNLNLPNKYWPKNLSSSNLVADQQPTRDTTDYVVSMSPGILVTPPTNDTNAKWIHKLIVTVTLTPNTVPQKNLAWFATMLRASITHDNKLQWGKMPSYPITGMNNQLWIMSGELATFKKALTEK